MPRPWVEFEDNGRGLAALTGFLLGCATLVGVLLILLVESARPFGVYWLFLIGSHMSEYLLTAAFRPDTLGFDNFLLNHSTAYQAMVSLAWAEFWIEWYFFGVTFNTGWGAANYVGVGLCLLGLGTRALGMATASTNFSHKIEERKRREHTLVTHGLYAVLRHPAYFGFFWWSVGSQVLLCNPVCTCAYAAASWFFFYDRIPHEEELLESFFGEAYRQYRKRTFIGIPLLPWAISKAHRD